MEGIRFRPLRADEIECRISSIDDRNVQFLLYKDARCDMNILDETVGNVNWTREHTRDNHNCIVKIWNESLKQWVSKEDVGSESNIEAEKGLASDSFKRACTNWGIGRELYTSPQIKIPTSYFNTYVSNRTGKICTNDRVFVKDLEVSEDENTGVKKITKLNLCVETTYLEEGFLRTKRDYIFLYEVTKDKVDFKMKAPHWLAKQQTNGFNNNNRQQNNNQRNYNQNNNRQNGYQNNNQNGNYQNGNPNRPVDNYNVRNEGRPYPNNR